MLARVLDGPSVKEQRPQAHQLGRRVQAYCAGQPRLAVQIDHARPFTVKLNDRRCRFRIQPAEDLDAYTVLLAPEVGQRFVGGQLAVSCEDVVCDDAGLLVSVKPVLYCLVPTRRAAQRLGHVADELAEMRKTVHLPLEYLSRETPVLGAERRKLVGARLEASYTMQAERKPGGNQPSTQEKEMDGVELF